MTTTRRLRALAERAATWLDGDAPVVGHRVPGPGWPGGVRDSDLTVDRLYAVLDEAFDGYHDQAVASLAATEVPR